MRCAVQMNVKFPLPSMASDQSVLHTSGVSADQLYSADVENSQYPIIIRIETLADTEAAKHHSLQERSPGQALVPWVQSQTTCVVLENVHDGGEERCKVVRQRIWVREMFYELQVRAWR
jgi:hypothetical protein